MEFYEFEDDYRFDKRLKQKWFSQPGGDRLDAHTYYLNAYRMLMGSHFPNEVQYLQTMAYLATEHLWNLHDRPYVKVFPAMAHMLSEVQMDIDCKHIEMPMDVFEVRLPKEDLLRESPTSPPLKSMLVSRNLAVSRDRKRGLVPVASEANDLLTIIYDCGEPYKVRTPQFGSYYENGNFYIMIPLDHGRSVDQAIDKALTRVSMPEEITEEGKYVASRDMIRKIVSLAIACIFFIQNQHEMVVPDLPRRLVPTYQRAVAENRSTDDIIAKAKKRGMGGLRIGEIELPRPMHEHKEYETTGQQRGQLLYRHLRRPHTRWQPRGPRRNPHYELVFIPPTVVRPDLPSKPGGAYKITDPE